MSTSYWQVGKHRVSLKEIKAARKVLGIKVCGRREKGEVLWFVDVDGNSITCLSGTRKNGAAFERSGNNVGAEIVLKKISSFFKVEIRTDDGFRVDKMKMEDLMSMRQWWFTQYPDTLEATRYRIKLYDKH